MMLVKNNRPCLHSIPVIATGSTIQLSPGVNPVPDEEWAHVEAHPMIQLHFKLGDLEVVRSKANDDNPLKSLSPSKAIKVVGETYDPRVLAAWKAAEARKPVVEAIDLQLATIDEETKPKSTDAAAG
jgi:hypothetical protein